MPLPLSVCRLETADEVKCGKAMTDKALAGEMIMEEVIFSFTVVPVMAIVGCILLYCFLKGN